jgi:Ni,Fe-hydrogenase III component G
MSQQESTMDTRTALDKAAALQQPFALSSTVIEPDRVDITIPAPKVAEAVRALRDAHWGYLAAITGLDHAPVPAKPAAAGKPATEPVEGKIEILYHFCEGAAVATLRTTVPYSNAVVPSICPDVPTARLYELELAEMFGVTLEGAEPGGHLYLPEDWPAGVYPLRKAFLPEPAKV